MYSQAQERSRLPRPQDPTRPSPIHNPHPPKLRRDIRPAHLLDEIRILLNIPRHIHHNQVSPRDQHPRRLPYRLLPRSFIRIVNRQTGRHQRKHPIAERQIRNTPRVQHRLLADPQRSGVLVSRQRRVAALIALDEEIDAVGGGHGGL